MHTGYFSVSFVVPIRDRQMGPVGSNWEVLCQAASTHLLRNIGWHLAAGIPAVPLQCHEDGRGFWERDAAKRAKGWRGDRQC